MRMTVETYRVIKRDKVAIGNFKHNTFSVIQPKARVEFLKRRTAKGEPGELLRAAREITSRYMDYQDLENKEAFLDRVIQGSKPDRFIRILIQG